MKKSLLIASILFCATWTLPAQAATTITTAEYVGEIDNTFNENVYINASKITFSSTAEKDVTLVGNEVFFDGIVAGDLTVIGKDVTVSGEVQGDIKIVAAKTIYSGNAEGDILFLIGELEMLVAATVTQDALIYGGTIRTNGSFEGNTNIVAGKAYIEGSFSDNVQLSAQSVVVGNVVLNNFAEIDYNAPTRAQVLGDSSKLKLNFNETGSWKENGFLQQAFLVFISFWTVLRFVTTVIIIFFFTNGFRKFTQAFGVEATSHPVKTMVVGAIALVGIPFLAIVLVISLVGLPIGILLGLFYAALFVIRYALISIVLGSFIKRYSGRDSSLGVVNFWYAFLGLVLMTGIAFIPYVGNGAVIILTLIAFGSVAYVLAQPIRRLKK
jgi:cytoskeletal protein CcmA (bactofilin family)